MRVRFPAVRILTLLLFALLCATLAYWSLQLFAHRSPVAPAGAVAQAPAPIDLAQASRLFGGATAAPTVAAAVNIQVVGVVAAGRSGIALLSIDGRAARPFQVGQPVADGVVLATVEPGTVQIEQRGQLLDLPAPARGSLTVLSSGANRPREASPATAPPVGYIPGPSGGRLLGGAGGFQPGVPLPSMQGQPQAIPGRPQAMPGQPQAMPGQPQAMPGQATGQPQPMQVNPPGTGAPEGSSGQQGDGGTPQGG
jgi:general secretion pathway protein C